MKVRSQRSSIARRLAITSAALVGTALTPLPALAQNATWNGPGNVYGASGNWTPATVPTNVATFSNTGPSTVAIIADASINEILFIAGASNYELINGPGVNFAVNGAGITNQSSQFSLFTNQGTLTFNNNALVNGGTAGFQLESGPPIAGTSVALVFNNNSGIGATVDLTSTAGSASAVGTAMVGGNAAVTFNDTSYADGADLRFFAGTGGGQGGVGASATGVGGGSTTIFEDGSHADNAAIGNVAGGGVALGGADAMSGAVGVGGSALLTFNGTSHADGATFSNLGATSTAVGGSNEASATSVSGVAVVNFNGDSHADNATFTNSSNVTTAIGGSGSTGTPGGSGGNGGAATAVGSTAQIVFNDNSHADNSTFTNTNAGVTVIGGSGGSGDTGTGGHGAVSTGVSGAAQILFTDSSHANNSSFTNTNFAAVGVGGNGGTGGTTGTGGTGGGAVAVSSGTVLTFSNATGTTGATIANTAGAGIAAGGLGGTGGNGGAGGVGGNVIAAGGAAFIQFTGTASAGTGTMITNTAGEGVASGGSGGAGGTGAAGTGGLGGNADAQGGDAVVAFQDNASAGNATITNTAGSATITGGNGGNGNAGNGGGGGSATAQGGDAIVRFSGNATAGSATIINNSAAPLTTSGGTSGTNGGGGGIGGASGGGAASSGQALIEFSDDSTGGSATITNNGGLAAFNDNSIFGTAAGASITNNNFGTAVFNDTSSLGSGTIQNNSGGSTIFTDTTTAGTGTINNGAGGFLSFFVGSSAGSATINNGLGGTTQFFDNSVAGTSTINNSGSLIFGDSSDAVAARVINSGTGDVIIGVSAFRLGSLSGGGTVNNAGNTIQIGYLDLNDTFSGVISGSGGLVKRGTGTFVLSGENTYGGGTSILAGTLQIGNGGTTGSVDGNILNNSALIFNRSNSLVYDDVISGSGTVTKNGAGTIVFTGENTYTGLTTVNQGTLQIGLVGTTGSVAGDILLNNDSSLAFSRTNDFTYAGSISGTGSMVKIGAGTLTYTGNNTYTGGTQVANGTLQIGNGGTTGSIAGNVGVGPTAVLAFNRSDTITYGGNVSGTGQLTKTGAGTLVLTGSAAHTGGTTVSQGTLQIGNGGTAGSITGNIINNATVAFNRSDTLTYSGVMSGTGGLIQSGTGTLVLTGANTHNGGTIVGAGTLQLNGSLASGVSIFASGRMTGTGTVNSAIVVAGTISPGTAASPLGTLTATGAVTFSAGSILAPTITTGGSSSLLQAGSLTINAGTVRPTAQAGGLFLMQTDYRIAAGTGGRTGTFGGVDESQLASFLDASLFYTGTEVFLRVRRNATTFAQTAGLTENQAAISGALDAAVTANNPLVYTTYLGTYNSLLTLQAGSGLAAALNTLSGDALTVTPVAAQEHASRFAERLGTNTWSNSSNLWGLIAYGDQDADSDGNGPGFQSNGLEFQMGFNTSLGANTRLGLSVGYNDGDVDLTDRAASAQIESWNVGAHLRHDFGPVYVSGQLTYSWHSIESSRALLQGGTGTADYDAQTWTGAAELGWVMRSGNLAIEPHLSIRHADTSQDAYEEAGPVGALNVAEADYQTTRFGVGIRLANRDPQAPVRFHALVRYEHETGDERSVLDSALPGLPAYRVFGTRLGDDIITADVGAEFRLSNSLSLFASAGGHTRSNETSINANAGVRIVF